MGRSKAILGDPEIREALRAYITFHNSRETDIIDELGLCCGKVRVDLVVVNDKLRGYEIKSDKDTLDRLPRQINIYDKVLDEATIVVGRRHLESAEKIVPNWWGLLLCETNSKGIHFKTYRQGNENPGKDSRALVELLWSNEAINLLENKNAAYGVRSKPRKYIWDRVCECFKLEEIATEVRTVLKTRAMTRAYSQPKLCDESCPAAAKPQANPALLPHQQLL